MSPYVGPLPAYLFGWLLAAGLTCPAMIWLMRSNGLSTAQAWFSFGARFAAIVVGAKLLYLAEAWPDWTASLDSLAHAFFSEQLRIPGGLLLMFALAPWMSRRVNIPHLQLADTIAPATGLALFGVRIGCYLEGCCHGVATDAGLGARFPPGSDAYVWQIGQGMISRSAAATLPTHPLQLYFALTGLAIFLLLALYQPYKRYQGEILLLLILLYTWSTWALEFVRARPHELAQSFTLAAALAATGVAIYIEWRRRPPAHPATASPT